MFIYVNGNIAICVPLFGSNCVTSFGQCQVVLETPVQPSSALVPWPQTASWNCQRLAMLSPAPTRSYRVPGRSCLFAQSTRRTARRSCSKLVSQLPWRSTMKSRP